MTQEVEQSTLQVRGWIKQSGGGRGGGTKWFDNENLTFYFQSRESSSNKNGQNFEGFVELSIRRLSVRRQFRSAKLQWWHHGEIYGVNKLFRLFYE